MGRQKATSRDLYWSTTDTTRKCWTSPKSMGALVLPEPSLDDDENDDKADNKEVEEYQRMICIGQQPILLGNFGLQRAWVLPEPCLVDDDENDDEADNEEEEEYQRTFLPERMLPRQQNFRIHPSKSTFYDEDLKATAYW
jgi:hypothetical protein